MGNRIRYLTACSIVPHPTTLPLAWEVAVSYSESCRVAGSNVWGVEPSGFVLELVSYRGKL
jgi:hypothetical protein